MSRFQDKVVLVTGGTSGLGAAACELFVKEGASVFVTDLEERSILDRLGSRAHFQKCDVSDPESCQSAIAGCVKQYGRLDVLFHNAGMLHKLSNVMEQDVAIFQRVINTDLNSLFYLARVAIPEMRKLGKGSIVTTASSSGLAGDPGLCSYGAAKAGIINLTRILALDHGAEGIRVNCVCPGHMVTPMTADLRANPATYKPFLESIPLKRGGQPEEIARVVLFLASDEASFMTGQGRCSTMPTIPIGLPSLQLLWLTEAGVPCQGVLICTRYLD